jgi:type II restriction/modification system DNA methylase subunit YeeA
LKENAGVSFAGTKKYGDFDIPGDLARQWLKQPNPNNRPNSDVVKPWANGMDIARRSADTWIIDFGTSMSEDVAVLYEVPYQHVLERVKPYRDTVRRERTKRNWWLHEEARVSMRTALVNLPRYIAIPQTAKHRFFVWLPLAVLPDQQLIVIARSDDTSFGVLQSRFHELWSLRLGASLEDRPRYTPTTTFETFPFPAGLTPNLAPAEYTNFVAGDVATAANAMNTLRDNWLNPPEWTDWVRTPEEEKAGYPARPVAKPGHEADLKKRTLTNLYNARPAWLDNAHKTLDAAVAKAYAWNDYTPDMADEEILRRLLALNLARCKT